VVLAEVPGSQETGFFQTSLDHVQAELRLTALRLHSRVKALRRNSSPDEADRFKGLYISETEIDDILEDPPDGLTEDGRQQKTTFSRPAESKFQQLEIEIAGRKKIALQRGVRLRLDVLQNSFSLTRIEIDTLLICLLAETDLRYQKLYAYLQDDITKKNPTVNLVLRLLCDSPGSEFQTRECFSADSPLIKYHLINLHDDRVTGSTSLLAKFVSLDEHITGYLLDREGIDPKLAASVSLIDPQTKWQDLIISADLKNRLQALIAKYKRTSLIAGLSGASGANKQDIAEAIGCELDIPLLSVNVNGLFSAENALNSLVPLIFREGSLQNAVIFLNGFDSISRENKETAPVFSDLVREFAAYPGWIVLGLEKEWQPEKLLAGKPCINVRLSSASYAERLLIWQRIISREPVFTPDIDIADLAGKFRFNSSQIAQAAEVARNLAKWRDPESGLVTSEDLNNACRRQSGVTLNTLARKVHPAYRWEDIILPKDQMEQLHEICSYVEHYHTVYDTWGFGRKLSLGKGLKVLFAGPSGTGKTMAAEVIANELKIDLYKIDLSTIVSKYIGETEKNLEKIFSEGQTSNAILFFDEADALFGKRSEVRDAHDRYANIETAYLLQEMDEYEGTVILATNLRKNMDEAFSRRMHYSLEFPLPEEPDRYRIWQQAFPRESPLKKDVDFKFLARQFKISGGNIKNIALNAAFLAASAGGGPINMENLIKATRREYQKIGKLCTEVDFGEYFDMVKI
jgi:hypothetical protein